MATQRVLYTRGQDGPLGDFGTYEVWLTVDERPNGNQFLLFGEIDNTSRKVPTRFSFSGAGMPTLTGECAPGQVMRVPQTGEATGLRIDGGRDFQISVG